MTEWRKEWKTLAWIVGVFFACFYLPVGGARFDGAVMESLHLVKWYAREHVLLCLVPAFFIAGGIGVFVSQASVMKYLGARANKVLAYGVASVSGTILAVCSCTVLPLFAGIYRMGAGLGPASAFLYSGPAINVLAIILTARVLGLELGVARAVGAISFSVIIGLLMHFIFRKEETAKAAAQMAMPEPEVARPLWQNAVFFATMIGVLVFANWGAPNDFHFKMKDGRAFEAAVVKAPEDTQAPGARLALKIVSGPDEGKGVEVLAAEVASQEPAPGVWTSVWRAKWAVTAVFALAFAATLVAWFHLRWWAVAAAAAPAVVAALVWPSEPMIPFAVGVLGLSTLTSLNKGEAGEWFGQSWGFAKQILPLLLMGVLVAGFLLGRPDHEGMIPSGWVSAMVGGNSLWANFFAAFAGAFMYFATLTEVPILQGLIGSGMGKGPALALLLAGPALSLPNMLVIRSVLGTKKTAVFVSLVIVMATVCGMAYGAWF
ncbi:MAG TPA: permease [Candidatus Brocadiia bacterium]|nr:permease [Candidatus Brocadiia bacterium]